MISTRKCLFLLFKKCIGRNLQDVTDFNNRYDNLNRPGESIFRLFLVSNNVISEEKPIYSQLHNNRCPEKKIHNANHRNTLKLTLYPEVFVVFVCLFVKAVTVTSDQ